MVQLSYPNMITGKTIALTNQTFVSKMMSLLFNTLSRFVIAILPISKHLLISWLQSPSVVILESNKKEKKKKKKRSLPKNENREELFQIIMAENFPKLMTDTIH